MGRLKIVVAAALSVVASACTPAPAERPQASAIASQSILVRSTPADGAAVSGPVDKLELWFDPPARLGEVTVGGPDGTMPMMVTAVGEVGHYSLPLPGLGAGSYTVTWSATVAGAGHQGSFRFTVR